MFCKNCLFQTECLISTTVLSEIYLRFYVLPVDYDYNKKSYFTGAKWNTTYPKKAVKCMY